jgi:hypothetical protein
LETTLLADRGTGQIACSVRKEVCLLSHSRLLAVLLEELGNVAALHLLSVCWVWLSASRTITSLAGSGVIAFKALYHQQTVEPSMHASRYATKPLQ